MKPHNKTTPKKTPGKRSNICRSLYLYNQTGCSKGHRLDIENLCAVHTGRTLTLSQLPKIPDAIVRDRSTPKNKTTKNMKQVIIKLTREYASGQRESWHKSFTEIDSSQLGARAFAGGGLPQTGRTSFGDGHARPPCRPRGKRQERQRGCGNPPGNRGPNP